MRLQKTTPSTIERSLDLAAESLAWRVDEIDKQVV